MRWLEQLLPGLFAYPNIHPMLVHFPVALLPTALLLGILSFGGFPRAHSTARLLLFLGALGMIAAVASGLRAQQFLPHARGSLVSVHRTVMLATVGLTLLVCLLAFRSRHGESKASRFFLVSSLLIVNILLVLGADRGALVSLRLRSGLVPLPSPVTHTMTSSPTENAGNRERGGDLYLRLGCVGCHGPDRRNEAPGIPPTLDYSGSKLQTDWVQSYLMRPHRIRWIDEGKRPSARMPDFQLLDSEAADLAIFLASKRDVARFPLAPVSDPPLTAEEAAEGMGLVSQYACRGCHSVGGTGTHLGPALDGVGARLQPAYVYAFLKDPKHTVPGTPMTDFHLWDDEAREITAYLATLRGTPITRGDR